MYKVYNCTWSCERAEEQLAGLIRERERARLEKKRFNDAPGKLPGKVNLFVVAKIKIKLLFGFFVDS